MSLVAFVIGVLSVIIILGIKSWASKNKAKLSWISWLGVILTAILALFSIAWFLSSLIEREIQAAGMGLLIFGGLAFISFGLTRKKVIRDTRPKPKRK